MAAVEIRLVTRDNWRDVVAVSARGREPWPGIPTAVMRSHNGTFSVTPMLNAGPEG